VFHGLSSFTRASWGPGKDYAQYELGGKRRWNRNKSLRSINLPTTPVITASLDARTHLTKTTQHRGDIIKPVPGGHSGNRDPPPPLKKIPLASHNTTCCLLFQIFKFGCFVSIPIVMMTYFRIPENVGHYVNRVRPPPCAQSVSANVPHSETPSRPAAQLRCLPSRGRPLSNRTRDYS